VLFKSFDTIVGMRYFFTRYRYRVGTFWLLLDAEYVPVFQNDSLPLKGVRKKQCCGSWNLVTSFFPAHITNSIGEKMLPFRHNYNTHLTYAVLTPGIHPRISIPSLLRLQQFSCLCYFKDF